MRFFTTLEPRDTLGDAEVRHGLRMLYFDAMFSQSMASLTSVSFMVAFAVLLGASNMVIGLLGAIGPLSQAIQIPAVLLVERVQRRKALTIASALPGRAVWLVIASLPLWAPRSWWLGLFLGVLAVYFGFTAVTGCAFSSWIRDLVPETAMAPFFSRRMMCGTVAGAVVSLLGGVGIDQYKAHVGAEPNAYALVFLVGALFGLVGVYTLFRTPEPRMHPPEPRGMAGVIAEAYRDRPFRMMVFFMAAWNFAFFFASPFFTVYMLKRLHLSMTWVIGMFVLNQLSNALFFPVWGRIADRFNNKSVLNLAVPMYFLLFLLWPLMTVPRPEFALLFVVVFHLLGGIATAGVTLSANNLVLMSTPRGRSTPHLAFNSLAQGLAASLAPILAGCAADVFERHAVIFSIQWHYTDPLMPLDVAFPALQLHGLDFVFLLAFVFGLYAVHRLLAVRERGEVPKSIVRREFFLELERMAHRLSIAPGVRVLTELVSSPNPEHRGGTGPDE